MPIIDSLRRRLSHRLESHQVDEDYSPRNSRNHSGSNSVLNEYDTSDQFDPEDIPSYEVSQLMYEQSHSHSQSQLNQNVLVGLGFPNSLNGSISGSIHNSGVNQVPPNMNPGTIQSHTSIGFNIPSYDTIRRQVSSNHVSQMSEQQCQYQSQSNSTNISRQNSIVAGSINEMSNSPHNNNNNNNNNNHVVNKSLKNIGLQFLNAKQHFALACCRDLSLIPCILGLFKSWKLVFIDSDLYNSTSLTSAKLPEHFLTGVWCIVAGYLSYSVLDGLMIRWIVTYSTGAAILRMLSMSTIIVSIEQYLLATFTANGYKYGLHIWILISCCLTGVYIGQNFVTSNLDLKGKRRARFFDFYNIVVFAVVPVGLASFITMIGLLRSLLIVRLDIEKEVMSKF